MAGTVATPIGATGMVDMATGQTLPPAYVNALRISAVTTRLLAHVRGDARSDNSEFCNLCLSLARGIDYAVSNNEIPGRAPDLPLLLNQVCQRKNDLTSQAAVMVLMISVKSACSNGWFSEKAKEELYVLSKEMQSGFCSVSVNDMNPNLKNNETNLHPTISTIMTRFYPGLKMGEIFSLVETKPGYDSYVTDMYISESSRTSPDDEIYLFVAQKDNVETSTSLINPQQVNFLLNGEGVDRRTCTYKDPGPQMPTPVTHMLKYGSNLLQVVGQFHGRYIIVIAFMSVVSNPTFPTIPDYVPPVASQSDPDNEIIEEPSTVSLKCPISFGRIKIPVKGHSCKHLQCFDFNNYVELNSRRPMWRCPHCSQSACFLDLRMDQNMARVLKEVGEGISYVKISGDGSWEAVTEIISNEQTEKPNDASVSNQETATQNVDDIRDLTENDHEIYINDKGDHKKPFPACESSFLNKSIAPHMEDAFWGEYYSPLGIRTTNTRSDVCDASQRRHPIFNSSSPGESQSQMIVSNNMQSQQNENSNDNGNGRMRYPTPATWITRIPNAIQALPAQNSQGQPDHSFLQSRSQSQRQSPTPLQGGARSASPLSTDRFNLNRYQSLNQRAHLPVRSSGQPSRVRPGGAHGGVGTNSSFASSPSQYPAYSLAAIQRATSQIRSQSPSTLPPVRTSGSTSGPVAATANADKSGGSADGNWRPTGRMRGSLSGLQYTEALRNQTIIQPSQPVQAARPPPILNSPRPFIPPHFQSLMANNLGPQAGGSSPGSGSESSMCVGPGSDK